MQNVAASDRYAVHGRDHGLGHLPDQAVEALHLEQTRLAWAVVARLGALLLIAAGGERPVARPGQTDHPDLRIGPRPREVVDQLVDGSGAERVHAVRPVDRNPGEAFLDLVAGVGQFHWLSFQAIVNPPLTDSVCPVMNPARSDTRNATAAAMSPGCPIRRIGTARRNRSINCED